MGIRWDLRGEVAAVSYSEPVNACLNLVRGRRADPEMLDPTTDFLGPDKLVFTRLQAGQQPTQGPLGLGVEEPRDTDLQDVPQIDPALLHVGPDHLVPPKLAEQVLAQLLLKPSGFS
ncbi:hypothetical protein [Arthrobacter sp. NPDC056727]|uniref:hypothetical protein n=1 Tax=Arthrobacter sp. NPDC056727 TaxID=3345927 RepID=UPI00366BC32C